MAHWTPGEDGQPPLIDEDAARKVGLTASAGCLLQAVAALVLVLLVAGLVL